jgi:hypothetical protein
MIFDWRKDEVLEMLGGDEELIEKFRLIKTEMFWLRESSRLGETRQNSDNSL